MLDKYVIEVVAREGGEEIVKINLDRVYRFAEYNNAISFAKQNLKIKGMQELITKLNSVKEDYCINVQKITEPEKEIENDKYEVYEKWHFVKTISKWAGIISFVISMVLSMIPIDIFGTEQILTVGGTINWITSKLQIIWFFAIPVFLITKIGDSICAIIYRNYTSKLLEKINGLNADFAYTSNRYYEEMDNLYLASLEPGHREMVIMRREQAEHNHRMVQYEKERQRIESDRLEEVRKARKTQEKLLEIEEERERRYKGWY